MTEQTIGQIILTAIAIAVGVGVGILFGAWLIQQAFGVLL